MQEHKSQMQFMHRNQGLTYEEIGKLFGVSRQRVFQVLRDYRTDDNLKLKKRLGINYCEICGISGQLNKLTIHFIDKNIKNRDRSNLQLLCWKCHKKVEPARPDTVKNRDYRGDFVRCVSCGKPFYRQPAQMDKKYCSVRCSRLSRYKRDQQIMELRRSGLLQNQIAVLMGTTQNNVSRVLLKYGIRAKNLQLDSEVIRLRNLDWTAEKIAKKLSTSTDRKSVV